MAIRKFTKQPNDVIDYDFDYGDWLVSGDDLQSAAITIDAGITLDSYSVSADNVKVWISGGTDGETYLATCLATTEGGREKEAELKIRIREES